ncbi:hypothetical protein [Caballeronia mineralivorans]|jgi:hypothetical protein|uniref:hypothetical protein n=1 Tax=Caballeronia mineralivorans TaxID=2010198 RepID=UPI003211D1E8
MIRLAKQRTFFDLLRPRRRLDLRRQPGAVVIDHHNVFFILFSVFRSYGDAVKNDDQSSRRTAQT